MDETQLELMEAAQLPSLQVARDSVSSDSWDTWEELLLASAVMKHGTGKWGLVSAELRARASARNASPSIFTPEACRSEYYVLRGRYGEEEKREGDPPDDLQWFEQLRKLRVAQLKRELEQFDHSIGFLEIQLQRLQSEREKSLHANWKELGKTAIPPEAVEYKELEVRSTRGPDPLSSQMCATHFDDISLESQAAEDAPCCLKLGGAHAIEEECKSKAGDLLERRLEKVKEELAISKSTPKCCEDIRLERDASQNMRMQSSEQDPYTQADVCIGCGDVNSGEQRRSGQGEAARDDEVSLSRTKELGTNVSISAEILAGSHGGRCSSQTQESNHRNVSNAEDHCGQKNSGLASPNRDVVRTGPETEKKQVAQNYCGDGTQPAVVSQASTHLLDTQTGGEKREDFLELETRHSRPDGQGHTRSSLETFVASEGHSSPKLGVPVRTPFSSLDNNQEGSETVNSPRIKHTVPSKHRRGANASIACPEKELTRLDSGLENVTSPGLRGKIVPEDKRRMPIESADSTEEEQQEEVPPISEMKKGKRRSLSSETASKSGAVAEITRELVVDSMPSNSDVKNESIPSTENSQLQEVWGESAEVLDDKIAPVKKKNRVTGWGKKRKSKKSITKDLTSSSHIDAINATNRDKETAAKVESMTIHEMRGSTRDREGKEAVYQDLEAWHGMERFSGDSRVERSEVGSFVDGSEDISPTSRRNRREPKVQGKLLPLLKSLRTVVAHRFAPLFKHSQASQDTARYDRLIRAHVDLAMVRTRLEEGQYSGSLHFFRDLLLMVNNALVYYARDSQEFSAATGLRECIVKEMEHVLETEALLKQEGPSIRKRDLKVANAPKTAVHCPPGKEEKKKGIKRSASNDLNNSEDLAMISREASGVVRDVGTQSIPGKDNFALEFAEPTLATKDSMDVHNPQTLDSDVRLGAQNEDSNVLRKADELKVGNVNAEPTVELEEARDAVATNTFIVPVKESKDRERRVGNRDRLQNQQGVTLKAARVAKASGVESSSTPKVHATRAQKPAIFHETVKRGVGRPPKQSHPHISQKPKEPEARRKLMRR